MTKLVNPLNYKIVIKIYFPKSNYGNFLIQLFFELIILLFKVVIVI